MTSSVRPITIRALTEQAVRAFPDLRRPAQTVFCAPSGRRAQGGRTRSRSASAYERSTAVTEETSRRPPFPETFRPPRPHPGVPGSVGKPCQPPTRQAEIPGQIDLFSEFDEAERVATEEESDNGNEAM